MKKLLLIAALIAALIIPFSSWAAELNNVTARGVDGNLNFYDVNGNIINTWDAANRRLYLPSGSTLDSSGTFTAADVSPTTLWGSAMTGTGPAVRQRNATMTSPSLTGASANTIVGTDSSFNTLWGSSPTGTGGAVRQLNATITTPTINSPQLTGASANTLSVVTFTATDASVTTTWGSSPTGTSGAVRQLNATLTTPTINSPQLTGASANTLSVTTLTASDASVTTTWGSSPTGTAGAVRQLNAVMTSPTINSPQLTGVSANSIAVTTLTAGDVSPTTLWGSGFTGTGTIVRSAAPALTTPNIGAATGTSVSVSGDVSGASITASTSINLASATASKVAIWDGSKNIGASGMNYGVGTGTVVNACVYTASATGTSLNVYLSAAESTCSGIIITGDSSVSSTIHLASCAPGYIYGFQNTDASASVTYTLKVLDSSGASIGGGKRSMFMCNTAADDVIKMTNDF